jgi:hypothetical protein
MIPVSSINKFDGLNAPYFFLQEYLEQYTDRPIVEKQNNDKHIPNIEIYIYVQMIRNTGDNKQIHNY